MKSVQGWLGGPFTSRKEVWFLDVLEDPLILFLALGLSCLGLPCGAAGVLVDGPAGGGAL